MMQVVWQTLFGETGMNGKTQGAVLGMFAGIFSGPAFAWAGMPAPFELRSSWIYHLDVLSFFVAAFLVATLIFMFLWNRLVKYFPIIPRLTYRRAILLTLVFGLFFSLVLTMIAGARELMTPGAWERNGATYELKERS